MAPPKLLALDEWLKWFSLNPLPTEIDEAFADKTVEEDVRPCTASDLTAERLSIIPGSADNVVFIKPEDASASATYQNLSDLAYQRFLTGTGGLRYMKELPDKSGKMIPIGPGVVDLCRDGEPQLPANPADKGGEPTYAIYRTANTILTNHPDVPQMREIQFDFKPEEIVALVEGMRMDRTHFGVNEQDHGRLLLFPDQQMVDEVIDFIKSSNSPIAAERRAPAIQALLKIMTYEKNAEERAKKLESTMFWQLFGMGALTIYTTMLATGKAGPVNKPFTYLFRGLFNVFKLPFDKGKGLKNVWNDVTGEIRYRGLSTVLSSGTNLTEMARRGEIRPAADQGTAIMIEKIVNRISTPRRAGSAIVEAPPGWGKEILMRNLALENPDYVFIQTQPDDLMAGTMYRGQLEEKLKNIPKEIEAALKRGQRVILCIDEFHEAITAGKSMEETRSLLERWKGALATGTLRIVGFSTPDEMLKVKYMAGLFDSKESRDLLTERQTELIGQWEADPAKYNIKMSENIRPLLNRFLGLEAPVRTEDDMRAILTDEIDRMKTQDNVELKIPAETVDLIIKMSESPVKGEGFIPRRAFDLFDGVIASVAEKTDMNKPIEITNGAFKEYVKVSWPLLDKRFGITQTNPIAPAAAPATLTPVPAVHSFTQEDFAELLKIKFQKLQLTVSPEVINLSASFAFEEWKSKGQPLDTVGNLSYPSEAFLNKALERIGASADTARKAAYSQVITEANKRGLKIVEDLPDPLKLKAEAAFKMGGK